MTTWCWFSPTSSTKMDEPFILEMTHFGKQWTYITGERYVLFSVSLCHRFTVLCLKDDLEWYDPAQGRYRRLYLLHIL